MPEARKPTEEELRLVGQAMQHPDVAHAAGLMLAAWRLYWLARAQMISVSKGMITELTFPIASQALSKAAMEAFKVGKFKNQIKNDVLPFLKSLAAKEARMTEAKNGAKPDPDPEPRQGADEGEGGDKGDGAACNP